MGVHGLATYLREHHRTLSKTFQLPSKPNTVVPIVVDGWSFIYEIHYHSNVPWVYGGEYAELHRLVIAVVQAWIRVGLQVYFVFDGACPTLKYPTRASRLVQSNVQPALLFFRTSLASRATFRFLNEARIIPPLIFSTCLHALNAARETTDRLQIDFADEEGDPYAVELAARLGGYVVGSDSDFAILNADGYLGYIPLEEMMWQASLDQDEETLPNDDSDFQEVRRPKAKRKTNNGPGLSRGIVPPEIGNLMLSLTVYSPAALAAHLKIPVPLLPLLGALVGNDFTRPAESSSRKNVQQLFFEKHLSLSQRIDHVASTLRTILNPPFNTGRKAKHQVGSVMDLIDKAVHSLLSRLIGVLGSGEIDGAIEKVVEAALQYAIPKEEKPELWPSEFCALHRPQLCPLLPFLSRKIEAEGTTFDHEQESSAFQQAVATRAQYLGAYRRGCLAPAIIDIVSHATCWPRIFLEHPDFETVSRSIGRPIREWGYAILHDAVGLAPDTREADETDSTISAEPGEEEDPDELVDVVESESDDGDDPLAPLRGELDRLQGTDVRRAYEASVASIVSSHSRRFHPSKPPIVTEYLRRGTRVAGEIVTVKPLKDLLSVIPLPEDEIHGDQPLLLRPLEARLTVFLQAVGSNNSLVRALPLQYVMAVVALRWVVHTLHVRAEEVASKEHEKERWTKWEARCFLDAFDWTGTTAVQTQLALPSVADRNVQLAAQVLSTLESIDHLAQILLLSSSIPSPSHLFSGRAFHSSLSLRHPAENSVTDKLLEAVSYGLDKAFNEDKQEKKKAKKAEKVAVTRNSDTRGVGKAQKNVGSIFELLTDVDAT